MDHQKVGLVLIVGALALVGCGGQEEAAAPEPEAAMDEGPDLTAPMLTAVANLQAREGSTVSGRVTFDQDSDGGSVMVFASVEGAPPGSHGFHIHEVGDCSAADFTSSGGHFNPAGVPHGGPMDAERHSGDLGNIEIGEDGSGTLELSSDLITLAEGQPTSIGGRAVILHEGTDDLESQPTGAAGGRIACGVISASG